MSRRKLRKRHVKVDKQTVFCCLALGFDKKRTLKKTNISERSYYNCKQELEAMSSEERNKILAEAKHSYSERIFDKKYWFKWDYLHQRGESQIDIIQKWYDVMIMRRVKPASMINRVRLFRDICFGVHGRGKNKKRIRDNRVPPHVFEEQDGVEWILLLTKNKLKGLGNARLVIRNFLKYARGIEPTQISGEKEGYGSMVDEYFRQEELDCIYYVLENSAKIISEIKYYALKFNMPIEEVQEALKTAVMFMNHSATRAEATCRVKAENFEIFQYKDKQAMKVTVFDKGKKGHEKRVKPVLGILQRQLLKYGIRNRTVKHRYEDSKLFPFNIEELRELMRKVYEKAGIKRKIKQPLHIWRHTFAKEYNRKTNYNSSFCCLVGGWKNEQTFKDCYGTPELKDFIPLSLAMN